MDEHAGPVGPLERVGQVGQEAQEGQVGEEANLGGVAPDETRTGEPATLETGSTALEQPAPEAIPEPETGSPAPGNPEPDVPEQEVNVPDSEVQELPSAAIAEADGLEVPAPESPAREPEAESPLPDIVEPEAQRLEAENLELPRRGSAELKAILEALIFASPDPLTPKAIFKLLDNEPQEDVLAAVAELKQDYERPGGLQLVEVAGGLQIVTRSDLHEWVRRLFHERSSQKLSAQALETLAVIAYRQSVTGAEITDIRGVNTSGVLNTLLERHLIKIVGRKQVVGRPFMYSTTKEFLIRFGLNDLTDLPKVEDMAEALGIENPLLVELAPREDLLPLAEPESEATALGDDAASDEWSGATTPDGPADADDPKDPDEPVH